MYIKMLSKIDEDDGEIMEVYDTADCAPMSHVKGDVPEDYANAVIDFWNSTVRPHESTRTMLKAREITKATYDADYNLTYDEDAVVEVEDEEDKLSVFGDCWNSEEFVNDMIFRAREVFGNPDTTRKQYDGMYASLQRAQLYVRSSLRARVDSTVYEAELRRPYFVDKWPEAADVWEHADDFLRSGTVCEN